MQEILKRKSLIVGLTFDKDEREFANRVNDVLGYTPMQSIIDKVDSCENVMRDLQIEPYDPQTVAEYKKAKEKEIARSDVGNIFMTLLFSAIAGVVISGIIGTVIATIGYFISGNYNPVWYLACMAIAIPTIFISGRRNGEVFSDLRFDWHRTSLCLYHLPIPEFVLQTALDLKERCPDLEMMVEELRVLHYQPDPFLVGVDKRSNEYYLEVWNEPGFHKFAK